MDFNQNSICRALFEQNQNTYYEMCIKYKKKLAPEILVLCVKFWCNRFGEQKGWGQKTSPPETLKCSKSKACKARKLKLHQPVYLII